MGGKHEQREAMGQGKKKAEVDVATRQDGEGARFEKQLVEDSERVYDSSSDLDKARDTAPQVHQGVNFDCTLASAKSRPGKERKTQIDGRRIEGVGQGTSGDFASDADMIEFWLHGAKTGFDVAQAFPVGELCESHTAELI